MFLKEGDQKIQDDVGDYDPNSTPPFFFFTCITCVQEMGLQKGSDSRRLDF